IAKTEGAQDLERGFVVSEVRPPKAGRTETVALEDLDGPRDGLALTALIERGVVAVDESVKRELDPTLGITPEELGMPLQDASRGRPRGSHTVGGRDRLVAIQPARHGRGGRPESRHDRRRAGERSRRTPALQAHRDAHTFSATSGSTSGVLSARVREASRSTTST